MPRSCTSARGRAGSFERIASVALNTPVRLGWKVTLRALAADGGTVTDDGATAKNVLPVRAWLARSGALPVLRSISVRARALPARTVPKSSTTGTVPM